MSRISVLGGSVAGLWAALTLARDGHDVTVYERDPAPPPDLATAVLGWDRPGTPHLRQSHAFLARAVRLLKSDHPALYAALRDAGAHETRAADHLPPWLDDHGPRPGDDDLVVLSARRPVFDWVLRSYADASGVRVEPASVTGLALDGTHVTGAVVDGGTVPSDVVVDATGRRTRVPKWLGDSGIGPLPEESAPCGNRYYTRYYALRDGAELPPLQRGFADFAELDACALLVFRGDGPTYSISIQTEDGDEGLKPLNDPRGFTAAAAAVGTTAPYADPSLAVPLNDPVVMAAQHNLVRRTVAAGRPLVTGLLLAGDATATSNPTYGRGVSLAMVTGELLREALAHSDPGDVALAYDAALMREVEPFVRSSREVDARTRARWRHALYGEPEPPRPEEMTYEDVGMASMRDRTVFDASVATSGLLRTPDDLLADPDVVRRVRAVQDEGFTPPWPEQPSRADLAAAVAEATR